MLYVFEVPISQTTRDHVTLYPISLKEACTNPEYNGRGCILKGIIINKTVHQEAASMYSYMYLLMNNNHKAILRIVFYNFSYIYTYTALELNVMDTITFFGVVQQNITSEYMDIYMRNME